MCIYAGKEGRGADVVAGLRRILWVFSLYGLGSCMQRKEAREGTGRKGWKRERRKNK